MFIVEVSYGCPDKKYPINGIFQMDQTKALADKGHDVLFVAIDMRSIRRWRKWGIEKKTVDNISVFQFNFPIGPILPRVRTYIAQKGFSRILKGIIIEYGKPDVVHVHFAETALFVAEECHKLQIPYVVTEHSSRINCGELTKKERLKMHFVYTHALCVIAVSNALAKQIQERFGVTPIVIPNIVDLSTFFVDRKKHDGFRLLSAASLNYGKGFDILLAAFSHLRNSGINCSLVIMGDGPERGHLESLAKQYGIEENVSFFGYYSRNQFATELATSDFFVLPSRGETFGVVYVEAMACGVPVIATRCGGPEDFVNDTNGLLVNIDNIDELAEAMKNAYLRNEEYNPFLISDEVRTKYSSESVADSLTCVFVKYLSKNT